MCGSLEDDRLEQLIASGAMRRWRKGEILHLAEAPVAFVYKITKGIVVEYLTLADGLRQIVGIRRAGDLCGYPLSGGKSLFNAQALTDVEACGLERHQLETLTRQPDVAAALAGEVSEKLTQAAHHLTVLGQLKALARVAYFLLELAELSPSRASASAALMLPLTGQDIGDYLGLKLETVSRCFTELRDMGVVARLGRDSVVVLDQDRLARIAKLQRLGRQRERT